jgi:hypothetical protein
MAQTAQAHNCRGSPPSDYQRHRPEQTVLYQIVAAYWHKFLQRAQEAGGVPDFVKREFEAYLDCGRLDKGHVLARCSSCGFERAVAFSCNKVKGRSGRQSLQKPPKGASTVFACRKPQSDVRTSDVGIGCIYD